MRANYNVTAVVYCLQAATDKKHKLFVHADIGAVTDKRELPPMALEVKHLLDLKGFNTLSDAGYSTGDQFQICKAANSLAGSSYAFGRLITTRPFRSPHHTAHMVWTRISWNRMFSVDSNLKDGLKTTPENNCYICRKLF